MKKEDQLHAIFLCAILVTFVSAFTSLASHDECSDEFTMLAQKRNFTVCKKMHALNSELAWHYEPKNNGSTQIDIFFGARVGEEKELVWVAWGVNPGKTAQMVGTKAIIGIRERNHAPVVNTYDVTQDTKNGCKFLPSPDVGLQILDRPVMDYDVQTHFYTLSAKLILPPSYNISRLNHVWQVGFHAIGLQPLMHPKTLQNVNSAEPLDLTTGRDYAMQTRRSRLRTVHGILNIIGWGTFLPIGVMIARYFRVHPIPLSKEYWAKLHVGCQVTGYTIGTIGWAIGLYLGHFSKNYIFPLHRTYAIVIFTCATAQVISLRLSPKETDEYRKYWNMYHHFLGYTIIAMIIINIFHGIRILNDGPGWQWTYVGLIGLFGLVLVGFEIYSWVKFCTEHSQQSQRQTNPNNPPNPKPTSPEINP